MLFKNPKYDMWLGLVVAIAGGGIAWSYWQPAPEEPLPMRLEFQLSDIKLQTAVTVPNACGIYVYGCDEHRLVAILTTIGFKAHEGDISTSFPMDHGPHVTVDDWPCDFIGISRAGNTVIRWNETYKKSTLAERKEHEKRIRLLADQLFY